MFFSEEEKSHKIIVKDLAENADDKNMFLKCAINLENYQLWVTEEGDLTPFSLASLLQSEEGLPHTDRPGVPTTSEKIK